VSVFSAALHEYLGYQYTITNTEKRQTVEAELWYVLPGEQQLGTALRRWRYFRPVRGQDRRGSRATG
jgi:hypothetical protein